MSSNNNIHCINILQEVSKLSDLPNLTFYNADFDNSGINKYIWHSQKSCFDKFQQISNDNNSMQNVSHHQINPLNGFGINIKVLISKPMVCLYLHVGTGTATTNKLYYPCLECVIRRFIPRVKFTGKIKLLRMRFQPANSDNSNNSNNSNNSTGSIIQLPDMPLPLLPIPNYPRHYNHIWVDITRTNSFTNYHGNLDTYYQTNATDIFRRTIIWHSDNTCFTNATSTATSIKFFNERYKNAFTLISSNIPYFIISFFTQINSCELWFPCSICVMSFLRHYHLHSKHYFKQFYHGDSINDDNYKNAKSNSSEVSGSLTSVFKSVSLLM